MTSNATKWVHGLIGGFIGAAAGSISQGFSLLINDPDRFNLGPQFGHTVFVVLTGGVFSGIVAAGLYLKQSPTPWDGSPDTDRRIIPAQTPSQQATAANVAAVVQGTPPSGGTSGDK